MPVSLPRACMRMHTCACACASRGLLLNSVMSPEMLALQSSDAAHAALDASVLVVPAMHNVHEEHSVDQRGSKMQ